MEGEQHPDRDAQFRYINEQVKQHQADDEPVISVDTKKKEMIGQLPNPGRQWRPKGDPVKVDDHSFFSGPTGEAAIPYGIYDLSADTGWINVGTDYDTSTFAVASIRRWWQARGRSGCWSRSSASRPTSEDEKPQPKRPQADKWAMNLAATKQYFEREGHLPVPRKHCEVIVGDDGEQQSLRLGTGREPALGGPPR